MLSLIKAWLYCTCTLISLQGEIFCAENNSSAGTLIVTYQTGQNGERLDRIRFLIKDNYQQCQMYPKRGAFIDDPSCFIRMVVIEDLPVGNYSLEFLVPNWDGIFEEVPPRQFSITKESVTKIDQVIKLHANGNSKSKK